MIKFRCSSLVNLMTEPRSKSSEISQTTKTFLNNLAIEIETGRKKNIETSAMKKGTKVENEALTMFCEHSGIYLPYIEDKGKKRYENEFITGTPDYVPANLTYFAKFGVIDIKSSWDLYTFPSSPFFEISSAYYWQMQGYMALTGADKATLIYVLVNTPEEVIEAEIRRRAYALNGFDISYEEIEKKVRFDHIFDDLKLERRIKTFEVLRNGEDIKKIYQKVEQARIFLRENYKFFKNK